MSVSKAIGIIEEPRGDSSCRLKVISFKRNNENITQVDEIKKEFPSEGYVFAPNFFEKFNHELGAIVEFSISSVLSKSRDAVLMDTSKDCRKAGYRVLVINENILINESSIQQRVLKNFINEELSHFYIMSNQILYGPFKSLNKEIIPKNGKEVNHFDLSNTSIYSYGGKSFLFAEPATIIKKIDCMTASQLSEWLKNQIKSQQLNIDFGSLRKTLELQELKELDKARMERALNEIDQLYLNHSDLRELSNTSEEVKNLYQRALNNINAELKQEYIDPILVEKSKIEANIFDLNKALERIKKEEIEILVRVDTASKEYDYILKNRDSLITDIRIHSAILESTPSRLDKLITYEEQYFKENKAEYFELDDFNTTFVNSININEDDKSGSVKNIIFQLKDYRCFLSTSVKLVLQIAKLSNNCKVVIQHAEPDWLKFEYLYDNGLKQIWESAIAESDTFHFFVLEDINIASFECYGKPVLDLVSGIRNKLPGLQSSWPKNLWIFGIPILARDGYSFALPLIKRTFENWGYLPDFNPEITFKQADSDKSLQVKAVLSHNHITPNLITNYFQD